MICLSQPALLSAVWYTGDMCGAGMLISRPGHHTISWPVSPDRSISCISYPTISYLLSRLSPAWLQPRLSWLPSPEPLSSLVPAIDLADILPRCCNHNVGENIERKVTYGRFYYCLNLCYKIWLFDEYWKSPWSPSLLSQCQIHILISSQLSPQQTGYWSDSDTSHHYFIFWVDIYTVWIVLVLSINSFVHTKENIDLVLSVTFLYLLNVEQRLVDIR